MMWHRATIQSRKQLSPTVTGLTLQIHQATISSSPPSPSTATTSQHSNSNFTFLPGQWVDFQPHPTSWNKQPTNNNHHGNSNNNKDDGSNNIPIGGYSITSIPNSLPYIDLAIQSSRHPVATWITNHAEVNDVVNLRVGGEFTYAAADRSGRSIVDNGAVQSAADDSTTTDENNDVPNKTKKARQRLLFVAGGVGINPLFSMIQQWHFNQQQRERGNLTNNTQSSSRAVLLYSAKRMEELLFRNELNAMLEELSDCFRVVLTTTTASPVAVGNVAASSSRNDDCVGSVKDNGCWSNNIIVQHGRVDHDMIQDAVHWINRMDNNEILFNDDEQKQAVDEDDMIADQVYICGPPGMPEDIQRLLLISSSSSQKDDGILRFVRSEDDVHFEKWW